MPACRGRRRRGAAAGTRRGAAPRAARFADLGGILLATLGAALCAAQLVGCASSLRVGASADPLAILDPGALAYVRLTGEAARAFVPHLLPPSRAASLEPLLARTRSLAAGVGPADSFGAALVGDYAFGKASLMLGNGGDWKRNGNTYVDRLTGLRVAIPGPDLVVTGSGDLEPLVARAKTPGPSPLPPRLEALSGKQVLIIAPHPFDGLASAMLGEPLEVPVLSFVIAADAEESARQGEATYLATVAFAMRDAEAARIYRPILRLAWYAIARGLFAEGAERGLAADFTLDGDLFVAHGVELTASAMANAMARLSEDSSFR